MEIIMPKLLHTISDYLESVFKNLTAKNNNHTLQTNIQTANINMQIMKQNSMYMQTALQDGMYQIFRSTNISPDLSQLNNAQNLLPLDTRVVKNTTFYYYEWTKTNTNVILTNTLTQKMNRAITAQRFRFFIQFNQTDDIAKQNLIQMYPAIYNGFRVSGCKDIGNSIILAVHYC